MNLPIASLIGGLLSLPIKGAAKVALAVLSGWIVSGAQDMLGEVVKVISLVSTPSLTVSWFSSSYWRIAGLAMLLTVPFLFAAAVQAVIRTDMGVLLRAAFIDLPIAILAVTLTAPLVALLLSATDEMCAVMTGGGTAGGSFLTATATNLSSLPNGFMLLVIAVMILLAGMVLMVELIMRAAAIYIVVLFLPLGFAAMVWPARRVWIKRMAELLIALILSKFAMVAILSLAVSGLTTFAHGGSSLSTALIAMSLMVLAAFSPWALLRLLPFTEIAAGAGAMLRQEHHQGLERGAGMTYNAASLALEPAAAGANALDHLVRNSATSPAGDRGGLAMLRTGSRGGDANAGVGAGAAPHSEVGAHDGAGPGGASAGASGSDGAGSGAFARADTPAPDLTPRAWPVGGSGGAGGGGGDGQPPGRSAVGASAVPGQNPVRPEVPPSTGGRGSPGPESGPGLAAASRQPIEEGTPILHPDNAHLQISLGRNHSVGWVSPADGDDAVARRGLSSGGPIPEHGEGDDGAGR